MNLWPFSKPTTPWEYTSHEYVGVENQAYTYLVLFKRTYKGKPEEALKTYKFHAHTTNQQKDEPKLVRFFKAEAVQMP